MEGKGIEKDALVFIKEMVRLRGSSGWSLGQKVDIVYTKADTSFWFDLYVDDRKHRVQIPEQYVDTKSHEKAIRHIREQLLNG